MPRFGETIHSALPQDIPWFLPDHLIFFGAFYAVLFVIVVGLGFVAYKTMKDMKNNEGNEHH